MVIMIALVQQEKNNVNISKAKKKFCLSLHYDGDDSYSYVNKAEVCKFKANDNVSWYNFYLRSNSKDFTEDKQSEMSLFGTVYDFSVDHNSIKKEDILNIHKYLIVKTNTKIMIGFLKIIFIG